VLLLSFPLPRATPTVLYRCSLGNI
jgi:hypothetical protein